MRSGNMRRGTLGGGTQTRMLRSFIAAGVAAVMFVLAGCGAANPAANADGKLRVTTTIGQITDLVEHIGGELVEVQGIMPSGIDPHVYKASQGDIAKF